jgi:hypothetical protein
MAINTIDMHSPAPFLGRYREQTATGKLTPEMLHFIELDKKKAEVKAFFEEYNRAAKDVVDQIGIGSYFQDEDGTVYKTVKPAGTFVSFVDYSIDRTRRAEEAKGSLSMKEAREAGYTLPETATAKAVKA